MEDGILFDRISSFSRRRELMSSFYLLQYFIIEDRWTNLGGRYYYGYIGEESLAENNNNNIFYVSINSGRLEHLASIVLYVSPILTQTSIIKSIFLNLTRRRFERHPDHQRLADPHLPAQAHPRHNSSSSSARMACPNISPSDLGDEHHGFGRG